MASALSFLDFAESARTVPTTSPATPAPATTTPTVFCVLHDPLATASTASGVCSGPAPGGGVALVDAPVWFACSGCAFSGPLSSGGTVTADDALGPMSMRVDQGFFPAALASMLCGPGSTGTAVPQAARPMN